MRERTGGGGGNNVFHGVLGFEEEPGFVVMMSGIKVRESHVDATQPNLSNQGIHVKNHPHINWDGGGGCGSVLSLSHHSVQQPNTDEETDIDERTETNRFDSAPPHLGGLFLVLEHGFSPETNLYHYLYKKPKPYKTKKKLKEVINAVHIGSKL